MKAIYLSGTGNTKHIIGIIMETLGGDMIPLEKADASCLNDEKIFLAYPTQFSNIPFMLREFINKNAEAWNGKEVYLLTTMGLFSGDGTGCAARLLKKHGANIKCGLQIKMPDSVSDYRPINNTREKNLEVIKAAEEKARKAAEDIKAQRFPREGLSGIDHVVGLLGQRLWFYNKTTGYTDKLKISDSCVGCGMCARLCPMGNLKIENGRAVAGKNCTMCYRCISSCPKKAMTLLGKEVIEQVRFEKFAEV